MKREIRSTTRYLFRWLICTGAITVQGISPVIARAEPPQGLTNAISTYVLVQPSSCRQTRPIAGISREDLSRKLSPELSWQELNSGYKKLMIKHHPDIPGGDAQVARMLNELYSNHPAHPNSPNNLRNKARMLYDLWEDEIEIFDRQRRVMPDEGPETRSKLLKRFFGKLWTGRIVKAWEVHEYALMPVHMFISYEAYQGRMMEAQILAGFSQIGRNSQKDCEALESYAKWWGYDIDRYNWKKKAEEFPLSKSVAYWYEFPVEAAAEVYHGSDPERWLGVQGIPPDVSTIIRNWDQHRYRGVEAMSPDDVLHRW